MIQQNVILVDEHDREVGLMEKMEAHHKGLLHRAFSVLVFNENGELLLQRRAFGKYHSEGLWTNTCCSHPYPGESVLEAGKRRLFEEMGFSCELTQEFSFLYKADLENITFIDDKNVLILKVDPSDAENHSVVLGYIKITNRLCQKKCTCLEKGNTADQGKTECFRPIGIKTLGKPGFNPTNKRGD